MKLRILAKDAVWCLGRKGWSIMNRERGIYTVFQKIHVLNKLSPADISLLPHHVVDLEN